MNTLRLLFASCAITTSLPAQLTINEVLVDPIGPDAGAQVVEIVNDSGATFRPLGWFFCSFPNYMSLPLFDVPDGGIVQLHIGALGSDTQTDWYLPTLPVMALVDSCQLYKSSSFHIDSDIVDHVSWGGAGPRAAQAANIGQWPSAGAFVRLPTEGRSIAFDGSGDSDTDWFRDATPTLGSPNGSGSVGRLGVGCASSAGVPSLSVPSPAVEGNLDFRFVIAGGPPGAPAAVFLGTPTGGLPVFGCSLEVLPFADVQGVIGAGGTGTIALPLVGSVQGLSMGFQALILDALAPNGLFGATQGLAITFGG